jgi:hypothetical protein
MVGQEYSGPKATKWGGGGGGGSRGEGGEYRERAAR